MCSQNNNEITANQIRSLQQQPPTFAAPESPSKLGTISRRKSVMNLGFNQTPTRRESSSVVTASGLTSANNNDLDEEMRDDGIFISQQSNPNFILKTYEGKDPAAAVTSSSLELNSLLK